MLWPDTPTQPYMYTAHKATQSETIRAGRSLYAHELNVERTVSLVSIQIVVAVVVLLENNKTVHSNLFFYVVAFDMDVILDLSLN